MSGSPPDLSAKLLEWNEILTCSTKISCQIRRVSARAQKKRFKTHLTFLFDAIDYFHFPEGRVRLFPPGNLSSSRLLPLHKYINRIRFWCSHSHTGPNVEFFNPKLRSELEKKDAEIIRKTGQKGAAPGGDSWVWLTSYSRIPVCKCAAL